MSSGGDWNVTTGNEYGCSVHNSSKTEVAYFAAFDSVENAVKRAELFCSAPAVFDALCDLVSMCDKELPEHLKTQLSASRDLIQRLRR